MTALAYGPHVATAGFVWEDRAWLSGNITTQRPLTTLTWQWVNSPQASHALNLVLHLTASALVGLLLWQLGTARLIATGAAALFSVHPVNVEAVAYAASRAELMAAICVLSACFLVLRGWWLLAAVCVACGLTSKETAAVALLLIPLVRWASGQAWKAPAVMCGVTLAAGVQWAGGWFAIVNIGEASGMQAEWLAWLAIQSTATLRLIYATLNPFATLTPDYDYDIIALPLQGVAIAVLVGLGLTTWTLRHQRLVACGLAWLLLATLPRLIVQTPRSYLNEHQFFIPAIGLFIAGAAIRQKTKT